MQRLLKSTSQQSVFFSQHPAGCSVEYLCEQDESQAVNVFKIGRVDSKSFLPPSFLVPAIMDAVKMSEKYGKAVKLVPGEADMYCARHVVLHGGLILTSDSDLLAHDLDKGEVALFRDIYKDDPNSLRGSVFSPKDICQRLKIPGELPACRFAYERKESAHGSLDAIIRACKAPAKDSRAYEMFCQQYIYNDDMDKMLLSTSKAWSYAALDPRTSELVLQLARFSIQAAISNTTVANMYLPVLIESPERGSAWEPSTPTRQLAYSIANYFISNRSCDVLEYRRVQHLEQKGRHVNIMSRKDTLVQLGHLSHLTRRIKMATAESDHMWLLLCVVINMTECFNQGKQSHVSRMLTQRQTQDLKCPARVPWDMLHFIAHLHAGLYSLRMLHQILSMPCKYNKDFQKPCEAFLELIETLPPLKAYPDIHGAIAFLSFLQTKSGVAMLQNFVHIPPNTSFEKTSIKRRNEDNTKPDKRKKTKPSKGKQPNKSTQNRFSALDISDDV